MMIVMVGEPREIKGSRHSEEFNSEKFTTDQDNISVYRRTENQGKVLSGTETESG